MLIKFKLLPPGLVVNGALHLGSEAIKTIVKMRDEQEDPEDIPVYLFDGRPFVDARIGKLELMREKEGALLATATITSEASRTFAKETKEMLIACSMQVNKEGVLRVHSVNIGTKKNLGINGPHVIPFVYKEAEFLTDFGQLDGGSAFAESPEQNPLLADVAKRQEAFDRARGLPTASSPAFSEPRYSSNPLIADAERKAFEAEREQVKRQEAFDRVMGLPPASNPAFSEPRYSSNPLLADAERRAFEAEREQARKNELQQKMQKAWAWL